MQRGRLKIPQIGFSDDLFQLQQPNPFPRLAGEG